MKDKLNKLLELVTNEEEKYYNFAHQCLIDGNAIGNQVNAAQASAFQRVRYTIEDILNN